MYDFSGEWAFSVGLPTKSGVSGVLMVVIPNVMGLCIWSPLLDENGNSIRGIEFCKELVKKYNFHNFDHILQESGHQKIDPRCIRNAEKIQDNARLLWACSTNEISEIKYLIAKGVNLTEADYDGRTGLHLAASEGNLEIVKILHSMGVPLAPKDRWGLTPFDDAKRENRKEVTAWFEEHFS
jgi:glutaminase